MGGRPSISGPATLLAMAAIPTGRSDNIPASPVLRARKKAMPTSARSTPLSTRKATWKVPSKPAKELPLKSLATSTPDGSIVRTLINRRDVVRLSAPYYESISRQCRRRKTDGDADDGLLRREATAGRREDFVIVLPSRCNAF